MTVVQPTPPISPLLQQLGFTPVGATRRRLFISNEGEPGTGKTTLLRTMPGPIAVINFDHGLEGVAELDVHGRPISQKMIEVPDFDESGKTMTAGERQTALASYDTFKKTVDALIKSSNQPGGIRTLGIDTGTAAYSLAQAARFGRIAMVGEVPPAMWVAMQTEFENIFAPFETHNCNILVTHRQGSKYKGLAGERELKGYKQMEFMSQIHLVHEKRVVKLEDGKLDQQLWITVKKCRQRKALEGQRFDVIWLNDEKTESIGARFVDIATAVLPNTTEADWL